MRELYDKADMLGRICGAWARACMSHPNERIGQVFSNAVGDPFHQGCEQILDGLQAYGSKPG
jgi:hypothetical protein